MTTYQHNAYGLTWQNMVEAFNGAIENDFKAGDLCGSKVITNEIEMKEGELISYLGEATLSYFEVLPPHEVTTESVSGSSAFTFDFIPDFDKPIKVSVTSMCPDEIALQECFNERCSTGEVVTYLYDEVTKKWQGILNREILSNENIFISYSVDLDELELSSLKAILRDLVACTLGNNLQTEGDAVWGLVTHYCERGDKGLERLEKGYIPAEFKRLKYLEWNGPFRAIRGNRV